MPTPDNQLELRWDDGPAAPEPPEPASTPAPSMRDCIATHEASDRLRRELRERTGLAVHLRITDNTSTMISSRPLRSSEGVRLSLHHMFLSAPDKVRVALAEWIRRPRAKRAGQIIDDFIREQRDQIRRGRPRQRRLDTAGLHHDLIPIFRDLNTRYFSDSVAAGITWGPIPARCRRRSIRFGSYSEGSNLIRIHRAMDQAFVPLYFVRYIVYHEMLHADLGIEETPSGRRAVHPRTFRELERAFPDYDRALAWMDKPRNMNRILNSVGLPR